MHFIKDFRSIEGEARLRAPFNFCVILFWVGIQVKPLFPTAAPCGSKGSLEECIDPEFCFHGQNLTASQIDMTGIVFFGIKIDWCITIRYRASTIRKCFKRLWDFHLLWHFINVANVSPSKLGLHDRTKRELVQILFRRAKTYIRSR